MPNPRVNLIRFPGAFAPNSQDLGQVTKAQRGRGGRRRHCQAIEGPFRGLPPERDEDSDGLSTISKALGVLTVGFDAQAKQCPMLLGVSLAAIVLWQMRQQYQYHTGPRSGVSMPPS